MPQVVELEPTIAILMLTAVNDATTAALCMQRGAMDYLTKPIDLSDLARAIMRAIRRRDNQLEQANLPGTTNEHPNWLRRWDDPAERLLDAATPERRLRVLSTARNNPENTR